MRGSITRRGKEKWLVRVFIGRDEHGRQRFHSKIVYGSRRVAERYSADRISELNRDQLIPVQPVSLGGFLADWLDEVAKIRCRANTYQTYVELVDRHIPRRLLDKRLQRVDPADLQALIHDLTAKGYSASTVRQVHAVLRSALRYAKHPRQLINQNPAQELHLPCRSAAQTRGLSREQVTQLLSALRSDEACGLLLETMLALGLRPSEASALRVDDLTKDVLLVRRRVVALRDRKGLDYDEPKSRTSRRSLRVPPSLLARLKDQIMHVRAEIETKPTWNDEMLLFPSSVGRPIARSVVRRALKRAAAHAGLAASFRLYDLRHCHATLLSEAGVPVRTVADQLGHANPYLTLLTYQHTTPDSESRAAQVIEGLLTTPFAEHREAGFGATILATSSPDPDLVEIEK